MHFYCFDIENFYPSISLGIFNKALQFGKNLFRVTDKEISIIMLSRRTLLCNDKEPWIKKSRKKDFDVPTGCFDRAKVSEIVGTYILSKINNEINKKEVGIYYDDGLGVLRNMSVSEMDQASKNLIKIFQECGLSIVYKINSTSVDFLDVHFGMRQET